MAKVKGFFYSLYKSIEDAQMRKAMQMLAEYKKRGTVIGGWQ